MCSWQYTVCGCQEYICSTVKLSQFLKYLPKHALQSSSCFTILKDQQCGLDMEIWFTPIRNSTYKRPFTQEGNYLVIYCFSVTLSNLTSPCILSLDIAITQQADYTISRTLFTVDRSGSKASQRCENITQAGNTI